MRIALGVEYDGVPFHGWQSQPGLVTVQEQVETVLSGIADHPVQVTCAGRTDTGVSAMGQVIHFDSTANRSTNAWLSGGNSKLTHSISFTWVKIVDASFHARFSALARHYQYIVYNHSIRPAVMHKRVTWYYKKLDETRMAQAAQAFLGEHDFSALRSSDCQSHSPVRAVSRFNVGRVGDHIIIDVIANAFLHHMVRNMVGILMEIGTGKRDVSWAEEVLLSRDRTRAAQTAPPYGLYLVDVHYPEEYAIPKAALLPFVPAI